MSTLTNTPEDRLREKMYRIPYREFSRNVIHKVVDTAEFTKLFQHGVDALTKEEKARLAKMAIDAIGQEGLILPLNNSALTVFVVATVVRMARH